MEVDCVDRVAELRGFLYEKMYGHFVGTKSCDRNHSEV